MSDFDTAQLGDICDINPDTLADSSDASARYRYIDLSSVNEQKIDFAIESWLFSALPSRARRKVRYGDVLLGTVRPNLKNFAFVSSSDKDLVASTGFAVLRSKEKLSNAEFIFHLINSDIVGSQLNALVTGSNYPAVNAGQVGELLVPMPPLPEQKKIAEILSGIEDSISTEWQKIRVLLEIRRASLKNLTFGKGAQAQRIDSGTEFGLIPSHWTCEQIPNCCLIENSKRKPIKKEDRSQMRGNYPYHGATRIQDYISEFAYEGEYVLIGEDGDHFSKFDDWEMAQFASGRFNVSNHAHVIKGGDRCRAKWLFYSLLHRDLTLHLTRQGATRFKLSKASLECIPILIPPLAEQDKMIDLFDSISSLIELRSKKVEKLNAAKAAIANDLLTGRKRVSI